MSWLAFAIVAALTLAAQSTVAPRLEIGPARPEWTLVIVVFYALHAPRREALIAAWILGAAADLLTIERYGVLSFSYLLAAGAVVLVREALVRADSLAHVGVTFAVVGLIQAAWLAYASLAHAAVGGFTGAAIAACLFSAAYTSLWALVIDRVLLASWRALGLPRGAATHRVPTS
ncbi:MAG: rod shape-determining protein MreD [Planctomycetota bacterium]